MKNKIKDLETLLNESKLDQEMRNILEELNEESELSTNDAPKVVEEGEPEEKSLHANNSDIEDMNDEEKTEESLDNIEKDSALNILKNNLDVHGEDGKIIISLKGKLDDENEPHIKFDVTEKEFDMMGDEFHSDEEKTEDVDEVVVESSKAQLRWANEIMNSKNPTPEDIAKATGILGKQEAGERAAKYKAIGKKMEEEHPGNNTYKKFADHANDAANANIRSGQAYNKLVKDGAKVMTEELKVNDAPEVVKPEAEEPKPVEATNADIEKMNDEEKTEDVKEVVVEEVNSASGKAKPGQEKSDDVIGHKFVVGKNGNDYNDVKKVPVYGQEKKPEEKTLINPGKDETKPTGYIGDNIGKQRAEWENKNKHNTNYDWQKIKGESEEDPKPDDRVLTKESEDPVLEDVVEPVTPEVETAEAKGYGDGEVVEHTHEVCPVCGKCKCKPGECECPEDERCKCEEVENPNEGVIDVNKELESVEQSLKEMFNLLTEEELSTNDAPKVVGGENPDEKTLSANNKDIEDMNDEKYADDVEEVLVESFSDYQLMQILEASGYEPSMENVAILRENEYIVLDEGKGGKKIAKAIIPIALGLAAGLGIGNNKYKNSMETDSELSQAAQTRTSEISNATKTEQDAHTSADKTEQDAHTSADKKETETHYDIDQKTKDPESEYYLDIDGGSQTPKEYKEREEKVEEEKAQATKQKEEDIAMANTKFSNIEKAKSEYYKPIATATGVSSGVGTAAVGQAVAQAIDHNIDKKKKEEKNKELNRNALRETYYRLYEKVLNNEDLDFNDCLNIFTLCEAINYSPKVVGGENPDEKTLSANNKDIEDMNDEKYADDVEEVLVEELNKYIEFELLEEYVYENLPELYELSTACIINEAHGKGNKYKYRYAKKAKKHLKFANNAYIGHNPGKDDEVVTTTQNPSNTQNTESPEEKRRKGLANKYRKKISSKDANGNETSREETDDEVIDRINKTRKDLMSKNFDVETATRDVKTMTGRHFGIFGRKGMKDDIIEFNAGKGKDLYSNKLRAVSKTAKSKAKKEYERELNAYRAEKENERKNKLLQAKRKLQDTEDAVNKEEEISKVNECINVINNKLSNMLLIENYDIEYSTLDEALSLGYEYFDTEEKVNTLAEQVAFTIANDNNDRLFEELVEATAKANRLYEAVLNKYFEVGQERAISILEELAANDAPEVVEEGKPEEKSFSATNADIKKFNDEEDSDDVEEVIVKESIMEFLKESEYEESEENVSLIESAMRGEIVLDEGIISDIVKKSLIKKHLVLQQLYDSETDLEKKDRIYSKILKLQDKMAKHGIDVSRLFKPMTESELSTNDSPKVVEKGKPEEKAFSADNKDIEKMNSEKKSDDVEEVIVENKVRVAKTPSETSYR